MADIDTEIMKKFNETSQLVQRFIDLLSELKAENDAHRARLDAMGEELLKTMENIQNTARECLALSKSSSKPSSKLTQSNKPSAEPKSPSSAPIRTTTVRFEIMSPTQQRDDKQLKQTATNRKLYLSTVFIKIR